MVPNAQLRPIAGLQSAIRTSLAAVMRTRPSKSQSRWHSAFGSQPRGEENDKMRDADLLSGVQVNPHGPLDHLPAVG